MKRLIAALLLMPALAMGAANDLFINQRDPTNAQTLTRTVTVPAADGILGYGFTAGVPGNRVPVILTIGSGLQMSSGVLSAVAAPGFSGVYGDLTGIPATFAPTAHTHAAADVTSGTFALARLPALPINQTTGLQTALDGKFPLPTGTTGQYLRGDGTAAAFPTLAPVATAGTYASLTGIPSTFTPSAHTHAAADITSGTLATARIPALAIGQTTGLQIALDGKFNTPTGTTAQYVRGDGSLATLPVAKRIETYSGTTNASGQITVTYGTAFAAVPVVQPPAPALANQVWMTVSSTTTGFTLQLNQRNTVTLLSIEVLLGATVPVVGTTANILVVAQ